MATCQPKGKFIDNVKLQIYNFYITVFGGSMKNIGLYLHIPFCDGKCAYCDFFSKCGSQNDFDTYTENLCNAIENYSKTYNRKVDTIYFGGGTPSLLGSDRLCSILQTTTNFFDVDKNAEITLECNPTSRGQLDFAKLKEAGFNRLSIGLQSANDDELIVLSRKHTAKQAKYTVDMARKGGFANISLDLMLCIPKQTKESLQRTIDFCRECDVEHISAYILKIEENTPFYKLKDSLPLFFDDEQADIYEFAVNQLSTCGYRQYEISNFAKKGFESRHNLKYWHDEEYIGLGPSAHSFIDGKRFYFKKNIESFYNNETDFESSGGYEDEYIMLALRLAEGLIFKKFEDKFGHKVPNIIISRANILQDAGLVTINEKSLSLTVKGFLVSNSIISHLLQ